MSLINVGKLGKLFRNSVSQFSFGRLRFIGFIWKLFTFSSQTVQQSPTKCIVKLRNVKVPRVITFVHLDVSSSNTVRDHTRIPSQQKILFSRINCFNLPESFSVLFSRFFFFLFRRLSTQKLFFPFTLDDQNLTPSTDQTWTTHIKYLRFQNKSENKIRRTERKNYWNSVKK